MNNQKTNKIVNYLLILVGVLSIIFAIACFAFNWNYRSGNSVSDQTYGGDAYTGIQNAAATAATNIVHLNGNIYALTNCLKMGFGFILLIFGLSIILYGVKNNIKEKTPATPPISNVSETISETHSIVA